MTSNPHADKPGLDIETDKIDGIPLITEPAQKRLTERQMVDYAHHRREFLEWSLYLGKNPEKAKGYSRQTMEVRASRIDQFYRWVWDQRGYTTGVTHEDADTYLQELAYSDKAQSSKAHTLKSLKGLFKWRNHEHNMDPWEPSVTFSKSNESTNPRDYLTREERRTIREAALEYDSPSRYSSLTPEQRDRMKEYIANQLGKAKASVTLEDWEKIEGWKYTSMTWTSLDCGLRPIEVERARIQWIDLQNEVLRIPKSDSSKKADWWESSIQSRTATALSRWLEQRAALPLYDDTDALWLTRKGNPYNSRSLSYLMDNLCEIAGISTENREITWYSIRRGLATGLIDVADLSTAQTQLRHKDPKTTMRYDQAPPKRRQKALDKLG